MAFGDFFSTVGEVFSSIGEAVLDGLDLQVEGGREMNDTTVTIVKDSAGFDRLSTDF